MFYNYFEKEKPRQGILHPIDENLKQNEEDSKPDIERVHAIIKDILDLAKSYKLNK